MLIKSMIYSFHLRMVPYQLYERLSQFPCSYPAFSIYFNIMIVNMQIILQI